MYKRLLYIFVLALTFGILPIQAVPDLDIFEDVEEEENVKATAYRYWIDDDTIKTEGALQGEDIESNINVSSLTNGLHTYHIQLKDEKGRLGTVKDIPFYIGYQNQDTKEDATVSPIKEIVYWFDDLTVYRKSIICSIDSSKDLTIEGDIGGMHKGTHSYTMLAINSQNHTMIITDSFYKPSIDKVESGEKETVTPVTYQYWVDDDKAHATTLPYTSDDISYQINYTQMAEGLHTLHFRVKNSEGIWTNHDYVFYTPENNSTEQADTQQPITGYRYGVNGKVKNKTLTEIDNIPSLSVEIPVPTGGDLASAEDYEFVTDNSSYNVRVNLNKALTYYIQFKNKADKWGAIAYVDSLVSTSTVRTAESLTLNRTLGIQKIAKGDYVITKFTIPEDNAYYFGASEDCKMLLYQDGKRLMKFTAEQLTGDKSSYLAQGTYFAIVYDQEQDGSIRLTDSKNCTADPEFNYSGHNLSITSNTEGANIYYTIDGSTPTQESSLYTGTIPMTYNATVKAIAICDGRADSYIKSYDVNDFEVQTCAQPAVTYDGRTVKLTTTDVNASIYYTEDGSDPTSDEARLYTDKGIAVESLSTLKAVTTKRLMNNSEVVTYEIPAYYDGKTQVDVKTAGSLSKAFEWNNGKALSDTLQVLGDINTADVTTLRNMENLKHLDLSSANIEGNTLAEQAFANTNLLTISLPATLTTCGKELLSGSKQLAAIIWNAKISMPADVLTGIDNPNLLLYVSTKSYAPSTVTNVVAGSIADNIVLTAPSGDLTSVGNFHAPKAFTAKKISYTRNFKQETEIGVCQGWETITLPFEATSITHETNGNIAPFAKGSKDTHPFWLYELSPDGGFEAASGIKANIPYIISMPNSQSYSDEYILSGNVTFSAENVKIAATEQVRTQNSSREFVGTFEQIEKANGIYALNVGQEYQGYRPGSIFAEDFVALHPFEAYLTTTEAAAKFISYFGDSSFITGITNLPTKELNGIKVWTKASTLYILSDKARTVQIYSTAGALVKTIAVEASETASVTGLPSGIYIVNKKKLAIP